MRLRIASYIIFGAAVGVGPIEAFASTTRNASVRLLSWWGYIDTKSPTVRAIEEKCRTKLSVDEFYSTTEFLERVREQNKAAKKYDVLIFSDTVYGAAETSFVRNLKTKLGNKTKSYVSPVRIFFEGRKYNQSTLIFQISLSGFLLNKNLLKVEKTARLTDFVEKSGDNIFVLMDDHLEVATLLNKWECNELKADCRQAGRSLFPTEEKLKKLVGKTKVVISSDLAEITKHPKFALAYTWSGDAIQRQVAQPNLEFLLHPSLSHTSMDLLTLVGTSPEAQCVANEMTSKAFVDEVAARSKYFSPYGPVASQEPAFSKLQDEFFKQFSALGRIHRVSQEESLEIDKKWQVFKILFGKKI